MSTFDVIASGELYKQGHNVKSWNRRRFDLSGAFWTYYDQSGTKKGQFDISGCSIRTMTAEECEMPPAKHAFALYCLSDGRFLLVSASSDKNRTIWMNLLRAQIAEVRDVNKRFLFSGEKIVCLGTAKRKVGLIGVRTNTVRLILTNFPRLLVIDSTGLDLQSQISWSREGPSVFQKVVFYSLF